VNQQMADMLGYTPEEMMGRSLTSFVAEEDRPDHITRLEVAREGKRGRFERRFITKDGKVRWIQVSATPLLDQNGTFRGSFGMCSDVTDHKAAEEKLRQNYDELVKIQKLLLESEKQYRQIVETTNEGIGKLDEKFETIYVNRRMADMLGYTPEEMIGRSYTSFMATEDVPDQTSRLEERRQGKSSRYERRFVTKDGKVRWIYVSATPILDPDGTFRGSFAMHSDITDRKAAEEGIVRSNEKLHATNKHLSAAEEKLQRNYDKLVKSQRMLAEAMDLANLVNWECDLNTGILTFDDRFSTLYGTNAKYKGINHMTAEAYLQKVVHPEDFHILAEEDEKTRNTTDPHYVSKREYRIIRGDGEVRHIEMCVGVTKDAKGRTIKTHGVNHDITERKKAEVALRESEEKFRKLVEYTLDGILILDFQGKILFVNQTAGQIVGAENYREMVSRRNVLEFIAPESQGDALRDFSQVAKGTDGYLARYKIITTTGLERWIECIGKNIRFERAPAILISICDITERKKAEVALRVSEEKFRSFVENAIDIMYSITPDGIYTYISPQCTELLGYETSEVLGKPAAAFIHPDDFPHNCECFRHTIRTGEKKNGIIFRIRHKNGTWRWYATTESPVHDAGGKVVAIQGICHDITERKEADEALRLANHRLNLLGSITRHDINNKITATFGYLKLAEMKSRDPALGVYFGKMESTITEIQSQIEFARIYHDLGTKAPQWIALNTAMSRLQVPATITLNSNVQGVEVFADPMLEKVFTNLLDNSIRHGKRVTEIRVSSKKSGGELVVIWEDNGIGVAADEKARIFERGFGKNSGLGLFLIREILSLTGITITETGEPGKGTRFEISIPDGKYRFITKYREETVLNESS
ncbi:MAG: PAS domain S-box protein, partial [Methanoregula sp.]